MKHSYAAVVIGASAGAFEALSGILPKLPRDYPLPIVIVVHLPPDRKSIIDELFQARCSIRVKEAEDKEPLAPATAYFAPPDYHLLIEKDRHLSLSTEEPVHHSRPSIDVLFESAADAFGPELVAVILSGANDDGARGLQLSVQAGGLGLVQSPRHSYATAMPSAAIRACPAASVCTVEQLAQRLQEIVS